ncbi:MAG TPA: molybdopterin cofactor-binding domain-containing protein [Vicinamibacteria bacterium]|nr:molybdopterin cofactor-binding domain-containing protein [Vicinamibacteria bacterium]
MPEHDRTDLSVVGRPLEKVDAAAKVTGQTLFADDLVLPRMAFARLLRSPHPHARIRRLDVSRAAAHPGVLATLVGSELPIPFGILPVSQDEHALALDRVRFVGDPVAAVAALDEETAEAALGLIEVDYEVLPALMSVEEALAREDVRIHDYGPHGNVHKEVSFDFGDVAAGFAEADHVREATFFFEGNTHLPLEQHAAVAAGGPDGKLTLWSSTQTPHYVHRALAKVLEMPPAHVRVIACPNGGGFGGKSDPFSHEIVVARLSQKTGRPVKVTLTREEVFYCHRGRHPVKMWVRTGLRKDGRITAMHFRTVLDGGAYGSYGVASLYYTGALQTVTYRVPRYRFDGLRVFTNKPPCGPKRGHGTPQPRFALECHIDRFCAELGLDPARWRLDNTVAPGTITANQMQVRTIGLRECLERVLDRSGYQERRSRLAPGAGIGIAGSAYISGAGLPIYWNAMPHSGVQIKIDRGGGVTVFCGSTDIGQGSDSVLAYVVAEELGISPRDIRVVTADTDLTPVDLGSYSSRVTLMSGNAAIQAARRLRAWVLGAAAAKLEVPVERLRAAHGRIWDEADSSRALTFAEAAVLAEAAHGTLGSVGSYTPPRSVARWKGAGVGPTPTYSYSAAAVEVSVDRETGLVRVEKVWIAHDVGRSINPLLVIGQVEGSVYMGLGEALMEEQAFRKGRHRIPSMLDYKSPTTLEMPPVESILVETLDPEGPYGAKECGQGPLLPVIPALANAIADAVGVHIGEVPITPEKVLAALEGRYRPPIMPAVRYPETVRVPPLEAAAPAAAPAVDPAVRP